MSQRLSVTIPDKMNDQLDNLVEEGLFSSKTAVVEEGLRLLCMRYSGFSYKRVQERVGEAMNP